MTDQQVMETLGENLRDLLRERGLSQAQLAELAADNKMNVSRWIRGVSVPSVAAVVRLCEALDISLDSLLRQKKSQKIKQTG